MNYLKQTFLGLVICLLTSLVWSTTHAVPTIDRVRCLEAELQACKCFKNQDVVLQCAATNTSQIQRDFGKVSSSGDQVSSIQIRESDVTDLEGLPEAWINTIETIELSSVIYEETKLTNLLRSAEALKHFVLDNANIPMLSRSHLDLPDTNSQLQTLKLINDKIKDIDESFFMHLNSIKHLELSNNELKTIPKAIFRLSNLEELDLNGNGILEVKNEDTAALKRINTLNNLKLDNINCSCDLSKMEFYKFVKERSLSSVICRLPTKFSSHSLSTKTEKQLCNGSGVLLMSYTLLFATILLWAKKFTA